MSLLKEIYGGVHGLDNYDRAINMINAAVEHHNRNDNFDAIADIEGLISFLKNQYHDFTPGLEQVVRDIIADEMGWKEEEEEKRWQAHMKSQQKQRNTPAVPPSTAHRRSHKTSKHHDALVRAARGEEEESKLDNFDSEREEWWKEHEKRKQARKYAIHGPSSRSRRLGRRSMGRLSSRSEQEEVPSLSDRRTRRDEFRPDVPMNRRGHRHSDPVRRQAQLMARKARPYVDQEQEEDKVDWNKEVKKFRVRRKKYEPEAARGRRHARRRMSGPSSNAFSVRFESFKGFLEKEHEASSSE